MNKLLLLLAVATVAAACNKPAAKRPAGADTTAVAAGASTDGQEADSTFFPPPDPLQEKAYADHEDMPAYFAFVGRFASYDELRQSPFYNYLCRRIPELAGAKGFAVNTTDRADDVWLLIPTTRNVWCRIKAFTPDMLTHHERMDDAKTLYATDNMNPLLIHAPMEGRGSIFVDLSAANADGYHGRRGAMVFAPCHAHTPWTELKLVPFDRGEDTVFVSIPTAPLYVAQGRWWHDGDNGLSVSMTTNGLVRLKDAAGRVTACSYINYTSGEKWIMAVKSDDGRRAVWEWNMADGEGATALLLTQLKGTILPESNKMYIFKEPET